MKIPLPNAKNTIEYITQIDATPDTNTLENIFLLSLKYLISSMTKTIQINAISTHTINCAKSSYNPIAVSYTHLDVYKRQI